MHGANWVSGIGGVQWTAPANDFSITAAPGTATVIAGDSVGFTVSTGVTSGVSAPITLSVTGLPDGASASFTPSTINAATPPTLTVSSSISAAGGTTPLTVIGTGTSTTQRTSVSLTINAPAVIRAAFYYPWFPEAWTQQGLKPVHQLRPDPRLLQHRRRHGRGPDRGHAVRRHHGRHRVVVRSGHRHRPALAGDDRRPRQGTGFGWAPYYEPEGISDPTPQQIADDLHYLWTTYAAQDRRWPTSPGKGMVVFVYNADDPTTAKGCDTVDPLDPGPPAPAAAVRRDRLHRPQGLPRLRQLAPGRSTAGTSTGPASAASRLRRRAGRRLVSRSRPATGSPVRPTAPRRSSPAIAARWQASIAAMVASGAQVAADHHLQRVGRGHRDRELLGLSEPGAGRHVLRLERRRHHLRLRHRPPQRSASRMTRADRPHRADQRSQAARGR